MLKVKSNQLTAQALMDWINESLPTNKRPYQIIIMDQLPYGFTGKIDRKTLRALAKKQLS